MNESLPFSAIDNEYISMFVCSKPTFYWETGVEKNFSFSLLAIYISGCEQVFPLTQCPR